MSINQLTDDNFKEVISSEKPVVLVFSALAWCKPCVELHKICEKLLTTDLSNEVTIYNADIEGACLNVSSELGIRGVPQTYIYRKNEMIGSQTGMLPESHFIKFIKDSISK